MSQRTFTTLTALPHCTADLFLVEGEGTVRTAFLRLRVFGQEPRPVQGVGGYSRTNADFIVFYQYLNQEDYIAYVPYGPEIEPSEENQGAFLEELSEALRPYLPKRCIALCYDLNWESHWCKQEDFDSEGNWIGLPKKEFQELQLNFGTVCHPLRKANTNILPANTVVVDLCRSEEEILCRMKSKTRYNIKLALRKGVEVRSVGIEGLPWPPCSWCSPPTGPPICMARHRLSIETSCPPMRSNGRPSSWPSRAIANLGPNFS